jgi:hypothetical protein
MVRPHGPANVHSVRRLLTGVAGTFSGKYLSDDDHPVTVEVTDGKFDLQFTKPEAN